MKALTMLLTGLLVSLLGTVMGIPTMIASTQVQEYSKVTDRMRSVMHSTNLLSPSEHLEIDQAANQLIQYLQDIESMDKVDVNPEEKDQLDLSSWDSDDVKGHCMEKEEFKDTIAKLFDGLVKLRGYKKRNARALLREIYHMSRNINIQGKTARCISDSNYEEILDLLLALSPKDENMNYLIVADNRPVSINVRDDYSSIDAQSRVDASNIAKSALLMGLANTKAIEKKTQLERIAKHTGVLDVLYGGSRQAYSCPYHYTQCCTFYQIPKFQNPQYDYLKCCFSVIYPIVAGNWNSFYGQFYPNLSPGTYTYIWCTLPAF